MKTNNQKQRRDEKPVFESSSSTPIEGQTNLYLEIKAMKNLHASSISVAADPYQASLPASFTYPLQAKANAKIAPFYTGDKNLDGGNVQQYSNGVTSKLLKIFDYVYFRPYINYGYAPMSPEDITGDHYAGKALIDERRRLFAETASVLQATTYTSLAINDYFIETDLPMGSAPTTVIDGISGYVDIADVLYATTTFYQLPFQALHALIKAFNSFRGKQGAMLRADFNRSVPLLNAYFTQMNKSATDGLFSSICKSFTGEYFDTKFSEVVNHFLCVPSRQANDLFHPLLEIGVAFSAPSKFKIHILDEDKSSIAATIDLMQDLTMTAKWFTGEETTLTIFEAINNLIPFLSAEKTAKWARGNTYNSNTAVNRFNIFKFCLDRLTTMISRFKPHCADIREALDILTRAGIVAWTKGYQPTTVRQTDVPLFDYLLVNDVFKTAFSGSAEAKFDNVNKRWKTLTLWNMYYGIPDYDTYNGGAFLTLSFKNLNASSDDDYTIDYVPQLFSQEATSSYSLTGELLNREGKEVTLTRFTTTATEAGFVTNRLAVLPSMNNMALYIPSVTNADLDDVERSMLYRCLISTFGIARITAQGSTDIGLDPDILGEYLIEVSDITNEAITYARSNGVAIRGNNASNSALGFSLNRRV